MRNGNKALLVILWILLMTTPALAGRIFVDMEMGQGWVSPGGFPTEAAADTILSGINDFPGMDSGIEFAGRAGYRFNDSVEAGFAFTRQNHNHVFSNFYSMRKYNFPASWYELFTSYCPWQSSRWRLDVGATAGIVAIDGNSTFTILAESPIKANFAGENFSFSVYTTTELVVDQNASLLFRFGYRQANITEVEDEDGLTMQYEGNDVGFDLSGLYVRIGVRLYLN